MWSDEISNDRACEYAALHFRPEPNVNWSFKRERTRLMRHLFADRPMYDAQNKDKGQAVVAPEGAISDDVRMVLSKRPAGKGSITIEELRWVMDHGEDPYLLAREVPNRGIVALWRAYKANPVKWLEQFGKRLIDATDPDAEARQKAQKEEEEASERAKDLDELQAAIDRFKQSGGESQ